jgi:hypothetical protein
VAPIEQFWPRIGNRTDIKITLEGIHMSTVSIQISFLGYCKQTVLKTEGGYGRRKKPHEHMQSALLLASSFERARDPDQAFAS